MDFIPRSIYTVSRLTAEIRDILETNFEEIWVEGEVSNLRIPPSGHLYFTLKDEASQIQAVIFRSQARFLDFKPEDGLNAICRGRISVYEQRGQYQLIVDIMEPRGMGALQLAFDQLKRRLEAEGLFDPSRKKPLPFLTKKIGIVTSPTGAVIRDVLSILKRRYENVGVLLYPVRVQGEGAAEEIAGGITFLDQEKDVDIIIVARGGGSLEDLWAFNEEIVARAIEKAGKPVVSAVGHEVDFTICDFVADLRAPTPSAAAELVVKNKSELSVQIQSFRGRLLKGVHLILKRRRDLWARVTAYLKDPRRRLVDLRLRGDELVVRLHGSLHRILDNKRTRLGNQEKNLLYRVPTSQIDRYRDSLNQQTGKLESAFNDHVRLKRRSLERSIDRLQAMSPLNILRRGYSIVRRIPSMNIVRDSRTVKKGETVDVKLHHGHLICKIERTNEK
ncbi:MAG: exodeoxyribonuclease VII large subunit [Proteobacteria bacterium]|nr:exodeoxyribonuclease VII large subunit [Pseudomonadota bacterium]